MKNSDVEHKLIEIIANYTEVEIKSISRLTLLREGIGLSSFDMVALIPEIEESFSISLNDIDSYAEMETIGEIVDYVTDIVNMTAQNELFQK